MDHIVLVAGKPVAALKSPTKPAPYISGMHEILKLESRIKSALDAMLECGRAFPHKKGTKIEVEVALERHASGYMPAVMINVKNAAGNAEDLSALKSKIASRAALLAVAMESAGTAILEGAKVSLEPETGAVTASLEVDAASDTQKSGIRSIVASWVFGKTYPGL